jgi:hypothetical protein
MEQLLATRVNSSTDDPILRATVMDILYELLYYEKPEIIQVTLDDENGKSNEPLNLPSLSTSPFDYKYADICTSNIIDMIFDSLSKLQKTEILICINGPYMSSSHFFGIKYDNTTPIFYVRKASMIDGMIKNSSSNIMLSKFLNSVNTIKSITYYGCNSVLGFVNLSLTDIFWEVIGYKSMCGHVFGIRKHHKIYLLDKKEYMNYHTKIIDASSLYFQTNNKHVGWGNTYKFMLFPVDNSYEVFTVGSCSVHVGRFCPAK